MKYPLFQNSSKALLAVIAGAALSVTPPAQAANTQVVLVNDGCLIIPLALKQGYFAQEGLEVKVVRAEDYTPSHDDYDSQIPLNDGRLTADLNWFHHVMYGAANGAPVKAVILLENAPGMKIMVAKKEQSQIKSAKDFGGKKIAAGALFSSKTYLTQYLMKINGVDPRNFTPIAVETPGRFAAVEAALQTGGVDVLTFMEPMTTAVEKTGNVALLYDLTTAEGCTKAFGAPWPAQSVFLASKFTEEHPEVVQPLVNAFVRAMRFVNAHDAKEIAAALPDSYFPNGRAAGLKTIKLALPTFAKDDYSFTEAEAKLIHEAVFVGDFDNSGEGKWRQKAKVAQLDLNQLYDNSFVQKAMANIK